MDFYLVEKMEIIYGKNRRKYIGLEYISSSFELLERKEGGAD